MKSFLKFLFLTLTFLSTSNILTAQTIQYPRFETDSFGEKVIVMTIKQAQSLDNATDLLAVVEQLHTQMRDYDSICLKVINDKEQVIASQKIEISKLKESLKNKDSQISALQNEVASYLKKVMILEKQLENRQEVIDQKDKQIRGMKTKMIFGGLGGTTVIVGLVLVLIL